MLRVEHLVALLDCGFGGLVADIHMICNLFVAFKRCVHGMLGAWHTVLGSCAHIACHLCKCVLDLTFLCPPVEHIGEYAFVAGRPCHSSSWVYKTHVLTMIVRKRLTMSLEKIVFSVKAKKVTLLSNAYKGFWTRPRGSTLALSGQYCVWVPSRCRYSIPCTNNWMFHQSTIKVLDECVCVEFTVLLG